MHAVLVAGSALTAELNRAELASADLLVAIDGGADSLARLDLVPHLLVGDLDSVSLRTRSELEARGVEVVLLPTAKDETDTEAALREVIARGAREITVLGALGGPRLDHLLGNLLILTAPFLREVKVRLVDELHEVFLANGEGVLSGERGDTVSLLPLTPRVESVRTEGLLYPLVGETLFQGSTRGVSNVMTGRQARVAHGDGVLLVFHYRGR